ncbi:hypothetical protein AB0I79_62890, partial [Nonomuraea sp. NPDC050202]
QGRPRPSTTGSSGWIRAHALSVSSPRRTTIDYSTVNVIICQTLPKPWIARRRQLEKIVLRRDPRDISRVWALDPDGDSYLPVPYRTMSRPPISLWGAARGSCSASGAGARSGE